LKFIGIPFKIKKIILSEMTSIGPTIHRIDFAAEADVEENDICLILECQTNLPTEDDITRFFQYVSTLRVFKNCKVELFILCTKKVPYDKKDFVIKEGCVYTMHMISLKQYRAREIFKSIEDKLENNKEITDEDIASLQIIVYTDFEESKFEIIQKSRKLLEEIAANSSMDINEKKVIIYLLDVLSTNMLNDEEHEKYMEENVMLINPVERYCINKGRKEGRKKGLKDGAKNGKLDMAKNMLAEGYPIEEIIKLSGLSKEDILNAK
jgi:predicted transposase/invertase (TIGR01784 family)